MVWIIYFFLLLWYNVILIKVFVLFLLYLLWSREKCLCKGNYYIKEGVWICKGNMVFKIKGKEY